MSNKRSVEEETGEQRSRRRIEQDCSKHKIEEEGVKPSKQVTFDPDTQVPEPSSKVAKMSEASTATSSSTTPTNAPEMKHKGTVRRLVEEVELYDEDEQQEDTFWLDEDSVEWTEPKQEGVCVSEEEKRGRGFFDEGAGPPEVSPEELKDLDKEAMMRAEETWQLGSARRHTRQRMPRWSKRVRHKDCRRLALPCRWRSGTQVDQTS